MRKADWYFDFLSPFAYLQNCRLDEFPSNLYINRKPLLFAGLLNHWGTKGPAELYAKRLFTYRHVQWLAGQLEVPLCFPENWERFCEAVNIPESEASEKILRPDIKQKLKLNGEQAIEQVIFGVPTLVVDGHLFWGSDSTDMALEYLSDPQLFGSSEMKRLETLPGY